MVKKKKVVEETPVETQDAENEPAVFPGVLAEVPKDAEDEQAKEEETEEAPAQEPPEETELKEEVVELTQAERLALLYQQILDIYNTAIPGHIPLGYVLEETGASKIEIRQTWDRLYDQRKVPYSFLYKPEG